MVITRHTDPPGLVLSGDIGAAQLQALRDVVLEAADAGGDGVRLCARDVPFLRVEAIRVLIAVAAELAPRGRALVLDVARHHAWAIEALGWADAPGLVLLNGGVPR
ncbi:hypothetical protein [Saccharothrix coeruleofusca]|uniref:STAS domain-containing protein n=1 Tax=Saccharothrix coeruleofusca TaxID=33919 RepID=A0A918ARQ4_9PSEU|nr:hypothetical protein [Saccharothrix coeruleofusca]MBP2337111.1 anti-anti-sigma regulatory factor [Saccharothrix coeruleofusca]GGP67057.1 hypothetical protein GCM10010185_44890 [Saccharothrix coeruleofusca]